VLIITRNYHVAFDNWLSTLPTSVDCLPDFGSAEWNKLFGDSTDQYVVEDTDASGFRLDEQHDDDSVARSIPTTLTGRCGRVRILRR
jgi:hypothetical protein